MKLISLLILFLIGNESVMAQDATTLVPASVRPAKITAKWTDRAQITSGGEKPEGHYLLWYREPAKVWEEALPLGNGRLGAMVFGGVADERIQLNESTLWDGYAIDPNNPMALKALPEVQKLLFEGKNNEAVKLAGNTMMGIPKGVKPYQSLGEIWFDTPALTATDYLRSLDLSTAITTTNYTSNGAEFSREAFISPVDGLMVIHFTANKKGQISFSLTLKRQQDAICEKSAVDPNSLILHGQLSLKDKERNPRGLHFAAQVKAITKGGKVSVEKEVMQIEGATEVILLVAGATNYPGLKISQQI